MGRGHFAAKSEDRNVGCYFIFDMIPISVLFCFPESQLIDNRSVPAHPPPPPKPRDSPFFRQEWRDDRDKNKDTLGEGKKKTYVHVCWGRGGVSFPRWLISSQ